MLVEENHASADAYLAPEGRSSPFVNARGIAELRPRRRSVRPEENQPGVILQVSGRSEGAAVALWALDPTPTSVTLDGQRYGFLPAPNALRTAGAHRAGGTSVPSFHPGTDTPRSFESDVVLEAPGTRRPVRISMNKPLRVSGFHPVIRLRTSSTQPALPTRPWRWSATAAAWCRTWPPRSSAWG